MKPTLIGIAIGLLVWLSLGSFAKPNGVSADEIQRAVRAGVIEAIHESQNDRISDMRAVKQAWFIAREMKDQSAMELFRSLHSMETNVIIRSYEQ